MVRGHLLHKLAFAILCASSVGHCSEPAIAPVQQIRLPVPSSRGAFDRFPNIEMSARDHYAMQVAPDQSILMFDSDTSGEWPLIRVRNWWTNTPANEVLNIPGWSAADAKYMAGIGVDVQVTPNGRYAVAFSEAVWHEKSTFLLHAPRGYIERKPDTIITVIDLEHWQVLKTIHTVGSTDVGLTDARILNNSWLAFDGPTREPSSKDGVYRFRDQLLSIPDLTPGPACISQRISHMGRRPPEALINSTEQENDTACRDVLRASAIDSTEAFDTIVQRGSTIEPKAVKLRDVSRYGSDQRSEDERLWGADDEASQFFRHWGEYPYYDLYAQNPPFESSGHLWYGLYPAADPHLYDVERYDGHGRLQASTTADHLLCGDPSITNPKSACGCRVIDVSEPTHALLTYCRQQRGDFAGIVQKQWLALFHSDDLTEAGFIDLPKTSETLQAIANGDGNAYVVTLEHGDLLRIYPFLAIPKRQ